MQIDSTLFHDVHGQWPEGTKMILRLSVVLLGKPGTGKSRAIAWTLLLLREITKRIWWFLSRNELKKQFPIWSQYEKVDTDGNTTGSIKSDWFLIWGDRIRKIFEEARQRNGAGIIVCDELLNKLGNIMQGGKQTAFQLICRLNSERLEPMLYSDSRYNFKGCSKNHINLLGGMTYDGYSNLLLNNIQSGGGARLFFVKICDSQISLPISLGFKTKDFFPIFGKTNEHIIDSAVNYWIINHINSPNAMSWQQLFFDKYHLNTLSSVPVYMAKDFFLQDYYKVDQHHQSFASLNEFSDDDDDYFQLPPQKKQRMNHPNKIINKKQSKMEIDDSDDEPEINSFPEINMNHVYPNYETRRPYSFFWQKDCSQPIFRDAHANDNPSSRLYVFKIDHPKSPTIEEMNANKFAWENEKLATISFYSQDTNIESCIDSDDNENNNNKQDIDEKSDTDDNQTTESNLPFVDNLDQYFIPSETLDWKNMDSKEAFAYAQHWINQAKKSGVYKYNGEILLNRGRQIILNLASLLQLVTNIIDKGGILGKMEHAYEAPYIYAAFRFFQIFCDELCSDYNYIVKTNMVQKKTIATTKFEEVRQTTITNFQPTLQQRIQIKMIQTIRFGLTMNSFEVRKFLMNDFRYKYKNFCAQQVRDAFEQLIIVGLADELTISLDYIFFCLHI